MTAGWLRGPPPNANRARTPKNPFKWIDRITVLVISTPTYISFDISLGLIREGLVPSMEAALCAGTLRIGDVRFKNADAFPLVFRKKRIAVRP